MAATREEPGPFVLRPASGRRRGGARKHGRATAARLDRGGPRAGPGRPPADVDELAATLACPVRNAGDVADELAAAAPAAGVDKEASGQTGTSAAPDVEPAAQPARRGHRRVTRRVDVSAAAARASAPPPAGTAATRR